MYQLFIFEQTFSRYQRHDIDIINYVTTLKVLQYTDCKDLIALIILIVTDVLYPSGFTNNNFIGHRS